MNHSKVWEKSKARIKTSQPQHAYSTWFDPIRSIGLSENELVLEVPNQFFFEWIDTHYRDIINKKVSENYGKNLKVKLSL